MIFEVRDHLRVVCALERGDWGAEQEYLWIVGCCFLNVFALYLYPFLSRITWCILCIAKGACSWMLFCMLSAVLYIILLKSNEHSLNQFSLQHTIKNNAISIPDHLCWGHSPPLQHISLRFLLNCSQASGTVQSPQDTCFLFLHIVLCLSIVRCWSDSHGELNKIVRVFSSIILQGLFL